MVIPLGYIRLLLRVCTRYGDAGLLKVLTVQSVVVSFETKLETLVSGDCLSLDEPGHRVDKQPIMCRHLAA